MGTKFGNKTAMPLLVSVRSGARDSMPGMMDTILNLGLNDQTVLALVAATKNERFAWDCYRRFVQMYGDVVSASRSAPAKIMNPSKPSSTASSTSAIMRISKTPSSPSTISRNSSPASRP